MKKYEDMSINDIIWLAKEYPNLYLQAMQSGLITNRLNQYFVELQNKFNNRELGGGFNVGDVYSLLSVDSNIGAQIKYGPWSRSHFIDMLNDHWKGPQALDIQLGGSCNCNCIYCDSNEHNPINGVDLKLIQKIIDGGAVKQIYICGLGEPTDNHSNITKLKEILQIAEDSGIQASMFTNLVNMDDELLYYLKKGILNILYKHDTNEIGKMQELYGCSKSNAQAILENINIIRDYVRYDEKTKTTNIGASIVPTKKNTDDIPDIIESCIRYHIYPLITGLERSGKADSDSVWEKLALKEESLLSIKAALNKYGIRKIDTCPAAVLSAHVTNLNFAVTGKTTGASCPWSNLKAPEYEGYAFLPAGTDDLWGKLYNLREERLPINIYPWLEELSMAGVPSNIIDDIKSHPTQIIQYLGVLGSAQILPSEDSDVFGGCGGETKEIQKVLALTTLDAMGRKRLNCLQRR